MCMFECFICACLHVCANYRVHLLPMYVEKKITKKNRNKRKKPEQEKERTKKEREEGEKKREIEKGRRRENTRLCARRREEYG